MPDFVRVKSYSNDKSTGTVEIIGFEHVVPLKDQNVLVRESSMKLSMHQYADRRGPHRHWSNDATTGGTSASGATALAFGRYLGR